MIYDITKMQHWKVKKYPQAFERIEKNWKTNIIPFLNPAYPIMHSLDLELKSATTLKTYTNSHMLRGQISTSFKPTTERESSYNILKQMLMTYTNNNNNNSKQK